MNSALTCTLVAALCGCADRTGLVLEVQGPSGQNTTAVGITTLRLVTAHPSYCGRWVTSPSLTSLTIDVRDRDLTLDPITILVSPDTETDLAEPVRAQVLALDATGQLLGVAAFSPQPFTYEEVRRYSQRIELLGRGARTEGPRYVADDGCVCLPGQPYIGTSSGSGCDQRIPPALVDYVNTAGCELPPGAALPDGVCDGQLYPGERANREVPCYATRDGGCRVGQRVCNDQNGRGVDRECSPADAALTLPTGALCDAFLACERSACGDPMACLKTSALPRKPAHCMLPLAAAGKDGAGQACDGGSWATALGAPQGGACVAAMIDGTRLGPLTLGWKTGSTDEPQLLSSMCPPTLVVGAVDVSDPAAAVGTYTFAASIGDQLYDVTLEVEIGCLGAVGDARRNFRCELK